MARSTATIQALIITTFQAQPELAAANSISKRSIWRLITFVVATAINVFEQLLDLFKANIQSTVALSAPSTPQWLQNMLYLFQYSPTSPQIIQLINGVPTYPVVNSLLNIITRVSVKTTLSNAVNIKVAKQNPPVALVAAELSAVQSYMNSIGVAGINYQVSSANPDQLYIQAQVFYQGAYAAIILANITTSINTFLASLPFDGGMKLLDLENSIRSTAGVNDVLMQNVSLRRDQDPISLGIPLVTNQVEVNRIVNSIAGYIVPEATAGSTLTQTLTLTPQ